MLEAATFCSLALSPPAHPELESAEEAINVFHFMKHNSADPINYVPLAWRAGSGPYTLTRSGVQYGGEVQRHVTTVDAPRRSHGSVWELLPLESMFQLHRCLSGFSRTPKYTEMGLDSYAALCFLTSKRRERGCFTQYARVVCHTVCNQAYMKLYSVHTPKLLTEALG